MHFTFNQRPYNIQMALVNGEIATDDISSETERNAYHTCHRHYNARPSAWGRHHRCLVPRNGDRGKLKVTRIAFGCVRSLD